MKSLELGITKLYNLFHNCELTPTEVSRASKKTSEAESGYEGILELRDLHRQLDQAVLTAYAWHQPGPDGPAIVLGHDFHEVETLPENDRTRYTITPQARKDLLTRLLKLNHHRAAEETAAQAAKYPTTTGVKARKPQREKQQGELL
jgi:hypothetical protein